MRLAQQDKVDQYEIRQDTEMHAVEAPDGLTSPYRAYAMRRVEQEA